MNLDALPHALLLILAEFSIGSLIAVLIADWRGMVPIQAPPRLCGLE